MKKFYIASSFKNIDTVRHISESLKNKGFIHTYDWTQNERMTTTQQLKEIGQKEKSGVLEADFTVVVLSAGKSSHIEFGIALGQGQKIYLYSPNDEINTPETTSTFYHLCQIVKCQGTINELLQTVCETELSVQD